MGNKKLAAMIGAWAYIIGMVIAIIVGVYSQMPGLEWLLTVLIAMGIVVGFLNVSEKETSAYLLAAVSLVVVTSLGGNVIGALGKGTSLAGLGMSLQGILNAMTTFVVPATIVVALKEIYSLAKDA